MKLRISLAKVLQVRHRFNKEKDMDKKDFHYNFMKTHTPISENTRSTSPMRAAGFDRPNVSAFFYIGPSGIR
jgi:hypothetical protein